LPTTCVIGTTGSAQGGPRERFVVTEAERRLAGSHRPEALCRWVAEGYDVDVVAHAYETTYRTVVALRADQFRAESRWGHLHARLRARPSRPRLRATRGLRRDERARCRLLRRRLRRPRRAPGRAQTVVTVDNEQHRLWVASRRRVELQGGEGFRAIHRLLGSAVEYPRRDAFALDRLEERFDFVCCFGILHRVENALGLLRVLHGRTVGSGTVLVETYGVGPEDRNGRAIRVSEPGEVSARDEFVYWGLGDAGLERIARIPGFSRVESLVDVEVDGDPRIIGRLVA
jgi:hypothetical protein